MGGLQDQEHGVVLHDQEEGYQPPITSRTGSRQVTQNLSHCHKWDHYGITGTQYV